MATANENTTAPEAPVFEDDRSIRGEDRPTLEREDRPTVERKYDSS